MVFLIAIMLILYTLACCVLIFVILIQSGKGGGLSSLGAASHGLTEALGATGAEKTLNRVTTWCAVGFMVLALLLSLMGGSAFKNKGGLLGNPQTQSVPQTPLSQQPAANGAAAPAAPAQQAPVAPAQSAPAEKAPAPAPAKK
jgi:preprotein translocase subunit SecG